MNVFKQQANVHENPNRNNFDNTYKNHLTMKMGGLYPVLCKPVVPGDSFRIDSAFGLRFMPMPFPTQTKMRAHMHIFYVRNKNIWKNFPNYLEGLEEHVHPYISQSDNDFFKTGSLADYLGVPSTISQINEHMAVMDFEMLPTAEVQRLFNLEDPYRMPYNYPRTCTRAYYRIDNSNDWLVDYQEESTMVFACGSAPNPAYGVKSILTQPISEKIVYDSHNPIIDLRLMINNSGQVMSLDALDSGRVANFACKIDVFAGGVLRSENLRYPEIFSNETLYEAFVNRLNDLIDRFGSVKLLFYDFQTITFDNNQYTFNWCVGGAKDAYYWVEPQYFLKIEGSTHRDVSEGLNPFLSSNISQGGVGISALPFRAYESIYYAYYANSVLQPLLDNNDNPRYNVYNHTTDDGADTTPYHIFTRNWETDFLTSCLPSPQQGNAPLVGMSALGDITLEDENGISTFHAELDSAGNISKVVATSPIASTAHARTAMNMAAVGMNINDFRGTNALQRFLEQSLRSGYKYKDFIFGHFGKSPKYAEMDMPEFIGGFSRDVQVNMISQTAQLSAESNLGDYAGQASCLGGSKHSISHYFDDYGFVVGILCVTPTPSYSQLLPHHFLHRDRLDYYFPEFSQIGMRPVTYEEVCPIEAYKEYLLDNNKPLTDTFGYQRPDWDLVSSVDEVHGLFRTDLSSYLVNRIYAGRPVLGRQFLEIDPAETNNIFTYQQENGDTIVGEVVMQIYAKRPVPRVVVPNLGR